MLLLREVFDLKSIGWCIRISCDGDTDFVLCILREHTKYIGRGIFMTSNSLTDFPAFMFCENTQNI